MAHAAFGDFPPTTSISRGPDRNEFGNPGRRTNSGIAPGFRTDAKFALPFAASSFDSGEFAPHFRDSAYDLRPVIPPSNTIPLRRPGPNAPSIRGIRQRQGSLSMYVSPPGRSTHVCIAEPDVKVERLPLVGSCHPQLCCDHSGIMPNLDSLI